MTIRERSIRRGLGIWKWASLVTIMIAFMKISIPAILNEVQTVTPIETKLLASEIQDHILQTSIQITMIEYVMDKVNTQEQDTNQEEVWQKVEKSTNGIGTLVSIQGETLLISHDHWSFFTSSTAPDLVIFRDSSGSMLLEMEGADLLPLILFHDSGTFILKAPQELAAKVSVTSNMGSFETLNPGDIVHVVHHSSDQENQISILAAEIIDHEIFNGVPMLSLRSLNEQSIEPGDSGGGIWVDGYLAGNLWMTVREAKQYWWQSEPSDHDETAFSLAAGLPVELIDLVETLLQVESPPTLETSGKS